MSGSTRRTPVNNRRTRGPPTKPAPMSDDQYNTLLLQQQQHTVLHQQKQQQQQQHSYGYNLRNPPTNTSGQQYSNRTYVYPPPNPPFQSPEQHHIQLSQYDQGPYPNKYHPQIGVQYDEFGRPAYEQGNEVDYSLYPGIQQPPYGQQQGNTYYPHPGIQQPVYPIPPAPPAPPAVDSYYTESPPTPATSDHYEGRKRVKINEHLITPHGSTVTPRSTPDEVARPDDDPEPKGSEKRVKPSKVKGKRDVPTLTAPLSELTKSYHHIPLKNMDEWVNRSVETRMKECGKKEGYIPRPMNSFMMYRSAYAERTKHWCLQNNHQVVSSVSGESWPLEPPEIRELYIEYAKQERENHAKAHPGYKFCPAKADATRRKRKGGTHESDDDGSVDLEDPDGEWQSIKRNKTGKQTTRAKKTKPQPYDSNGVGNFEFQEGYQGHELLGTSIAEQSTFQFNNPGVHCPPQLGSLDEGEYYQSVINSNPLGTARVEDVSVLRAEAPQSHYGYEAGLVGLPGAHHEGLLDREPGGDDSKVDLVTPIDPQLDLFNSEFDFDQIGTLNGSLSQIIFNEFENAGTLDNLEPEMPNTQANGNRDEHQNDFEHSRHESLSRPPDLNESGYEYIYNALYQDMYPNEEPGQPSNHDPNSSEKASHDQLSPKHQQSPEHQGENSKPLPKADEVSQEQKPEPPSEFDELFDEPDEAVTDITLEERK